MRRRVNPTMTKQSDLTKRIDGKYEEHLGNSWTAEYFESSSSGLWRVELFVHDVPEWVSDGYLSLDEARQAARNHFNQV